MGESVTKQHQPSLTEWLAAIGEAEASQAFRDEDNRRTERLVLLKRTIGLPYREPLVFPAADAHEGNPAFAALLAERGDESCAFRLVPTDPALPKLRNRGLSVRECYQQWFKKLDIDKAFYELNVLPNELEVDWSTIFVVRREGVFGEIVRGKHSQLTQGETEGTAYRFSCVQGVWEWSTPDPEAQQEMERVLRALRVEDPVLQKQLQDRLEAEFADGLLSGYFETTTPHGEQAYFIDYNRILPKLLPMPDTVRPSAEEGVLRGAAAAPGSASGPAVLVAETDLASGIEFAEGSVLVCDNTDVRYLPYMKKAAAIVTERGGMLSHAAIIARELGVPCVVGVKGVLEKVASGDLLVVDGSAGTVLC